MLTNITFNRCLIYDNKWSTVAVKLQRSETKFSEDLNISLFSNILKASDVIVLSFN